MALKGYGVLKGTPILRRPGPAIEPALPRARIDEADRFRVAINVFSSESPSEVEYLIDEHFQHPILEKIHDLHHGYTELADRRARGSQSRLHPDEPVQSGQDGPHGVRPEGPGQ